MKRRTPLFLAVMMTAACSAADITSTTPNASAGVDESRVTPPTAAVGDVRRTSGTSHTDTDTTGRADVGSTVGSSAVSLGALGDAIIPVDDAALPTEVVAAYEGGGGDLLTPSEWIGRFGWPGGFTQLVGDGVRLVEVTHRSERSADGSWRRLDEASWLTADRRSRDDLLDEIATTVGVGAGRSRAASIDDGADCVVDTYPTSARGEWTLQGCTYPRYSPMMAIGATRRVVVADTPAAVDATVTTLTEVLGGRVSFIEVRLTAPGTDGSTLHTTAQLTFDEPLDVDTTTDLLIDGPLAGWQVRRGDDSAVLSGPTGATWTLTAAVAVFDWAGRW